jgi:hypothetical protein
MAVTDLNLSSLSINTMRRPGRTISLRVLPDGTLKVNAPLSTSQRRINGFLASKANWIARQLNLVENLYDFSPQKQIAPRLTVEVVASSSLKAVSDQPDKITIFKPDSVSNWQAYLRARPLIKRRLGELAKPVILTELSNLAGSHGYSYSTYSIKFMRSRWGSCTAQGKIALNSQLIRLPVDLRLYVIAHELAHLRVANHSSEFYRQVSQMIPGYKQKQKELKQYGLLH